MRSKFDHEFSGRELLDAAKPHWISAVIGLATTAASAYAGAKQRAAASRNARNAAALGSLPGSAGGGGFQPSALSAMARNDESDFNAMGLADLFTQQAEPAEFNELPLDQAMFSPESRPEPVGGSEGSSASSSGKGSGGGMEGSDYIDLASSVGSIAAQLAQPPPAPPGAPIPQPGAMNFQPTALAMLARRRF